MAAATASVLGFTSHLHDFLADSRASINEHVKQQKQRADEAVRRAKRSLHDCQQIIDQQTSQLLSVQLHDSMELGDTKKEELHSCIQQQHSSNEDLYAQLQSDQRTLQETQAAHRTERAHYQASQRELQQQQDALLTTIDDLTTGILNYKLLGVDFSKADHDRLKFTFLHLNDNHDDAITASFELGTTDDELWNVVHCLPPLDEGDVQTQLDFLNHSNDMGTFMKGMRRLFMEALELV